MKDMFYTQETEDLLDRLLAAYESENLGDIMKDQMTVHVPFIGEDIFCSELYPLSKIVKRETMGGVSFEMGPYSLRELLKWYEAHVYKKLE